MSKLAVGVSAREGFAAVALGLLGAAALPPVGLFPAAIAVPALLLLLLRNADPQKARNLSLVFGIVYALGTMYWMWAIFRAQAIPLWALMAGYFGLLGTLIGMTRDYKPWVRAALVAMFAVGIEWLRGDAWYLRFPWYTPPHGLAQQPMWIAPARWLGVYGFSLVIWFIAAAGAFRHAAIWLLFGLIPLSSYLLPSFPAPDRQALLVQSESEIETQDQINAVPDPTKVDLAVLPELAFMRSPAKAIATRYSPQMLARKTGSPVVFGAVDGDYFDMNFRNLAAVMDADGKIVGTFQKQKPVPLMADGAPGTERPVFALDQGTLGVAICYDFDAPTVATSLAQAGATVLVVPTFDRITWSRMQHAHHELLLRIRALETDRWILRAASSGRTEVIDPHGNPSARGVEIGGPGHIVLPFAHRDTFALGTRLSPLGPIAAAGSLFFIVWHCVRRWRWRRLQ